MSPERQATQLDNKLYEWLATTDPTELKRTIHALWDRGSYHPSPYKGFSLYGQHYRREAQKALAHPPLKRLYELTYPENIGDPDLLNLAHINLQTMTFHDHLLKAMDHQSASVDIHKNEWNPLLNGAEPDQLVIYNDIKTVKLMPTPAVNRRMNEGLSTELKVLSARMRLDIFSAHLRDTSGVYPHDTLWWRQAVVDTLQLTSEELDLVREIGVIEDAAAA